MLSVKELLAAPVEPVPPWRQALSLWLTAPSCSALLSLWLPVNLALMGGALAWLLTAGQWLLSRIEGDQQRILLSSQWSLFASLLICLAVIWWQGPMAALAAALSLGTGWAWFSQARAFWLQLLASGLSMLIALLLGQDDTIALLWAVYLPSLWFCIMPVQPRATTSAAARRIDQTSLIFWGSRILATLLLLTLSTGLWLLSPRLQGAAWLPLNTAAHLQMAEGKAAANRELLATRNRLQQEWLLTLNIDPKPTTATNEFAAFGERFSLDQLAEQGADGPLLARVKSPQAINLQVSRFDWFDGTQWVNTGAQSEAVFMPDEGLLAAQDSRLWLSVRWLQPSAKTLAVPGGWQWLLAPSDTILVGAQSLALPQVPPAGFSYRIGSHGLSLDGHPIAQRDELLHPNYLAVPEALKAPLNDWLQANLPALPDAWQKALWLEQHLQTRYGANRAAVSPSYKRDPIVFYLNEQTAGRSEAAASALTLLLRSLGIPARLSCGWALTRRNPFTGLFDLNISAAHCYSEAFINNHGWVELEASSLFASRPSTQRLSVGVLEALRGLAPEHSARRIALYGLCALALLLIGLSLLRPLSLSLRQTPLIKRWRLKRLAKAPITGDDPAEQSLARLLNACELIGYRFPPGSGIYPWACLWQTLLPDFDAEQYCADFYHHHFGLNTQGDISAQHQTLLHRLSQLPWQDLTRWVKPHSDGH